MGDYSSRFIDRKEPVLAEKPTCWGDVEYYDKGDDVCIRCPVRGSCAVQVNRQLDMIDRHKRNEGVRTSQTAPTTRAGQTVSERSAVYPPVAPIVHVDVQPDDSWWQTWAHNGFLGATEAMARELVDGIHSIPRRKYPNPFQRK